MLLLLFAIQFSLSLIHVWACSLYNKRFSIISFFLHSLFGSCFENVTIKYLTKLLRWMFVYTQTTLRPFIYIYIQTNTIHGNSSNNNKNSTTLCSNKTLLLKWQISSTILFSSWLVGLLAEWLDDWLNGWLGCWCFVGGLVGCYWTQ